MLEEDRRYIRRLLLEDLWYRKSWADVNPEAEWPETHAAFREAEARLARFDEEFPNPVIPITGVKRQA